MDLFRAAPQRERVRVNGDDAAIVAHGMVKRYARSAQARALDGFDLDVPAGSVCGLLGPNGAGKTTAIRILATLLAMDEGSASVAGFDVRTQPRQVRQQIGLVGQHAAVDEILTGRQNLILFGRLNHLSLAASRQRADELLERFALTDAAEKPVSAYSGGMRRRLDLAASLIVSPPVLFVDEPTTGLDPIGRREVWTALRDLVDAGTTLLLTTQYLEEADQLADRIVMLKAGRVVAKGTPGELKAAIGGDWLDIALASREDLAATKQIVAGVASGELRVDESAFTIGVPVAVQTRALVGVATALHDAGIEPLDITLRRPTLDEAFIHLTGDAALSLEVSA